MTGHSPGPWIAGSDDNPSEIVAADVTVVAEVGWIDKGAGTAVANRNLIAAAPELLDELSAAATEMRRVASKIGMRGLIDLADDLRIRAVRAEDAIAKAEGAP